MRTFCIGVVVDSVRVTCGKPIDKPASRCPEHEAINEAVRRPSPSKRGYDREYQRDRAEVLKPDDRGLPPACELRLPGCTYWADTADHVDPVSLGGARGPLVPACKHCNSTRGNRPYFPGPVLESILEKQDPESAQTTQTETIMPDGTARRSDV